jgi:mannose/fructose/N-acetylgalactosamine-specific phosphotransferase system component IIC
VTRAHLFTILLGGLAALDATPFAQTLFSQPLVTATLLGIVWGDLQTALEVGIVLQILAASTLPVGARTPEDYAVGGVVGTGVALTLSEHMPFLMARNGCAMLGVMVGMLAAALGVALLKWQRRTNERLAQWCENALRSGHDNALVDAQRGAIVLAFGVGVAWTAICLGASFYGLRELAQHESIRLARAWTLAQPLWLGLGLAQILNVFLQRRLTRAAVFGAALLGAWLVLLVGNP